MADVMRFGGARLSRRDKAAQESLAAVARSCPNPVEFAMSPKQFDFHAHCGPYVTMDDGLEGYELSYDLYGGAAGGGKSRAACDSALLTCVEEPGSRIAIMRKTKRSLDISTKRVFLDYACPENSEKWQRLGISWNKQDDLMTLLATGDASRGLPPSTIEWIGIQTSEGERNQAWERFLSTQYSRIYIDEAGESPEEIAAMLPTRCRLHRPGVVIRVDETGRPCKGYRLGLKFTSNPNPGWLKRWFIDPIPLEEPYKFIQSGISDNRKNLPPGYEKQFSHLPEYLRKRFLDGDWSAFEGQVFPGGVNGLHALDPIDATSLSPKWWNIIQAVDPGLNDPTAAVWAAYRFDDEYQAIVFLEDYLERESTVEGHAMRFREVEMRLGLDRFPHITRLIDPDANKRTLAAADRDANVVRMFAEFGLHFQNAPNSTWAKTLTMSRALRTDPDRRHPATGEAGAPMAFFCLPACRRTAAAITDLQWDRYGGDEESQTWANRNKHLPDVATYVTAYLRTRERKTERRPMPSRYRMRYEEYA